MRKFKKKFYIVLGVVSILFFILIYLLLIWRNPFPIDLDNTVKPLTAVDKKTWWKSPAPLSEEEIEMQRWLSSITWQLPKNKWGRHWNVGGSQTGIYSIRYQAAFCGYASALLGMRTPAYPELTTKIIDNLIEHIVDKKAWTYISIYWQEKSWYPNPCYKENIMFTGHLMQLMATYEAINGNDKYRKKGVEFIWDNENKFRYNLMQLVDVTIKQMNENLSGGVSCEPSLIFFPCNNHPQNTLLLLEKMGIGNWKKEREKWEKWALSSYHSVLGGGAFKLLYNQKNKCFVARGHPGLDAWSLCWYVPWVSDTKISSQIWLIAKEHIPLDKYSDLNYYSSKEDIDVDKSCCDKIVNVAPSATASFIAPAARACGDPATAKIIEKWLEHFYLKVEDGKRFLSTNPQWRIGVTANYISSNAMKNGSDIRSFMQNPLPRDYFSGPIITSVKPERTAVYQAYRPEDNIIIIEVDGDAEVLFIKFKNVKNIVNVSGAQELTWDFKIDTLILQNPGRQILKISVE